jgi:aldose 1-epimerase
MAPARLALADERARVAIVPELGAGLASYDLADSDDEQPLFRRCREAEAAHPFDLACNLLIPWSGRVSGGGFSFGGQFYPLAPTIEEEPLPIHGNGFAAPWTVLEASPARASLGLRSAGPGPYDYEAEVAYALADGALSIALAVTHRGADPLPYGLGLHPWLPRTPATTLWAPAATVTIEDSRHLPAGQVPVAARRDWNFNQRRRLPGAWVNNDFSPWPGQAEIAWPDRGLALDVSTGGDPHLSSYILYSPASDADFFCFEPVTHPVDAHNQPGGPERHGLVPLAHGEQLAVSCRFTPRRL